VKFKQYAHEADGGTARRRSALVVREGHMFASLVAPPRVLPLRDVLRFLRLITSSADEQHVPLSAVAALCRVSRLWQ
jgi:hypothetical protein